MQNDLIIWDSSFSVNHDVIDEQHKVLIDIINKFYHAFENARAFSELKNILDEMVDYARYHFAIEEKIIEDNNLVFLELHKKEHEFFIEKAKIFQQRFLSQDITLSFDVMDFLRNWLIDHILVKDKYLAEEFKKLNQQ